MTLDVQIDMLDGMFEESLARAFWQSLIRLVAEEILSWELIVDISQAKKSCHHVRRSSLSILHPF